MKNISGKNGNNVAKKQELFNCLLFAFLHTFQILFTFSIFKTHFFTFFPSACSKRIFHFFSHFSQKCENNVKNMKKCILKMRLGKKGKNAFWRCTWKKTWKTNVEKCEKRWNMWKLWKNVKIVKNVKKCGKKHIWRSSWEGGTWIFWGPVLLQLLCCLPNFCRLKIGEEQFKSIGSGLCRSQICLIYL